MGLKIEDNAVLQYIKEPDIADVIIPDGIRKIDIFAFEYCNTIEKVHLPDSVTEIADCAFKGCSNLTEIVIPRNVKRIGTWAFINCTNLADINISEHIADIGIGAFLNTPWLEKKRAESPLVIINGILVDGTACSGDIKIPNNIQKIAGSAFEYCQEITSITISENIKSIGSYAFRDCANLKNIYYGGSEKQWKSLYSCNYDYDTIPEHTIIHWKQTSNLR